MWNSVTAPHLLSHLYRIRTCVLSDIPPERRPLSTECPPPLGFKVLEVCGSLCHREQLLWSFCRHETYLHLTPDALKTAYKRKRCNKGFFSETECLECTRHPGGQLDEWLRMFSSKQACVSANCCLSGV